MVVMHQCSFPDLMAVLWLCRRMSFFVGNTVSNVVGMQLATYSQMVQRKKTSVLYLQTVYKLEIVFKKIH